MQHLREHGGGYIAGLGHSRAVGNPWNYLKPGDKPEVEFRVKAGEIKARGYCNIHGFWKSM